MSLAPTDETDTSHVVDEQSRYREALRKLGLMIHHGKSFSGHERNCCYLNTRAANKTGGGFANVSAASGLDFEDDGRGLAIVDWDHDGDLDFWTSNRTGPQARYLRNDAAAGNHFIAFKLQGTTANRDAIGARVEIVLPEEPPVTLIKTLRGGEGFVSQSSKWVHFGLGQHSSIQQLTVRWPDGSGETFAAPPVDGHYQIVQGEPTVRVWKRPSPPAVLAASQSAPHQEDATAAIVLPSPLPLPALEARQFSGESITLAAPGRYLLLNVWASWCQPCLSELADLKTGYELLQQANVDVMAIAVDGVGSGDESNPGDARQVAQRLELPFATGLATLAVIDKLALVQNQVFMLHQQLPVPFSVLIDRDGKLAALYRGRIAVEPLLRDVARIERYADKDPRPLLPFPGTWIYSPFAHPPNYEVALPGELLEHGYLDDAEAFLMANREAVMWDGAPRYLKIGFARILTQLGITLRERGAVAKSEARLREAIEVAPLLTQPRFELARTLHAEGKTEEAATAYQEVAWLNRQDVAMHARVAAYLNELGEYEAASALCAAAIETDPRVATAHEQLGVAEKNLGRGGEAQAHFRAALELEPERPISLMELGVALITDGQSDAGLDYLRRAVERAPKLTAAHINLAVAELAAGDPARAELSLRTALDQDPNNVDARFRLGVALWRQRQVDAATAELQQVIGAAPKHGPAHYQLAQIHGSQGDVPGAVAHFRKAAESDRRQIMARGNLAWILATSADDTIRDGDEAVRWAEEANRATSGTSPQVLMILAAAHAEAGAFDQAIAKAEKGLAIAGKAPEQAEFRQQLGEQLARYRARKPLRVAED